MDIAAALDAGEITLADVMGAPLPELSELLEGVPLSELLEGPAKLTGFELFLIARAANRIMEDPPSA